MTAEQNEPKGYTVHPVIRDLAITASILLVLFLLVAVLAGMQ